MVAMGRAADPWNGSQNRSNPLPARVPAKGRDAGGEGRCGWASRIPDALRDPGLPSWTTSWSRHSNCEPRMRCAIRGCLLGPLRGRVFIRYTMHYHGLLLCFLSRLPIPMIRIFVAIALAAPAAFLFAHEHSALSVAVSDSGDRIVVKRDADSEPIVTQVAKPDFRPYLHPIVAPDGRGELTQYSPSHHKHQTGLYWGFTRVNGRDYFHHPESSHWKRVSVSILKAESDHDDPSVSWQTVYDMLDEDGSALIRETQTWSMRDEGNHYLIDLNWQGFANTDIELGKYDYGGLFLRMPWTAGMEAKAVNSARQEDARAEGQRAVWMDVGIKVDGREDKAHITIFDHPKNNGFPRAWRVDGQYGIGPATTRLGDQTIAKDETLSIRHRLVVHSGELNDVWVTDRWSEFSGQDLAWAQWNVAQQEGRDAEFLTPEKAVENMTLKEGFAANVFAAEPMITQPMAFCWDDRGRLWIAENRDYESRGKGFSNDGKSRILILEDTDGDGVADSRKVFLEGIPFPAAMAVGMDGLWLGAPPNLLFVPDRNNDDRADMDDIEVRLTGWGIRDRHETLNSFRWGPDGWLYGCQGYATPSQVGRPKGKGKIFQGGEEFPNEFEFDGDAVDINGGVWRYHPIKDRFEVVSHGFSNPWGLDYDSRGQLFITACVIPHLWHVIPGGIYHRQGGQHFNRHVYSDIRTIADHRHRSAHGRARVYQSDAFPEQYKNRIFMANIHEHAVLTDILEPSGSGFIGRHGDDFVLANNAQWIGFSVEIGPDGNLYVLDWHDADICGKEVLQKETGRVFRFTPDTSNAKDFPNRHADLSKLSDIELVKLQSVESAWHAGRARVILQHRAAKGVIAPAAIDSLRELFVSSQDLSVRLRAMWGLHVTDSFGQAALEQTLQDRDEYVRAWAIQLLCEDRQPPAESIKTFTTMAKSDPSPVVRLYLASAVQRMDASSAWPILEALASHGEDADDHNLPKMIWFALEPLVMGDVDRSMALAHASEIPMLTRHIARRIGDDQKFEPLVASIGATQVGEVQQTLLLGLRDAVEGRFDMDSPTGWGEVYPKLRSAGGETAKVALQLSQQFGDSVAAGAMLETLIDPKAETADRLQSLTGLSGRRRSELKPHLIPLMDDDTMRRDAIRAVSAFDDRDLAKQLLERYKGLSAEDKLEVVHALSSRSGYANELTDAMDRGEVPREDVPAYIARILRRVVGNRFADVWGPIDSIDASAEQQFAKYRELATADALRSADASAGRAVFNRTCAACHKLYGHGGNVGPDISGANRSNLEYLLGNILTPSAIIQEEYKMHIILTDDGRVYSGIPAEENEQQLKLRVADRNEPVTIAKSQIESREIAPVSMMPQGTLETLSDADAVHLLKYLQTTAQVPLP